MASKRFDQVDTETGEILGGFVAVIQPKRRNGFNRGWVAMSQQALELLARMKRLDDHRVMLMLLSRLDFENLIQISQSELAADLSMQRSHVNRAIKHLLEMGAILEGPKIGRSRSYRLNPAFGWKGSAKGHQEALQDRMRARGMTVIEGDAHKQESLL